MNQTREPYGHLSLIMGVVLALTLLLIGGIFGQKAWTHQAQLTKDFKSRMEDAPFKKIYGTPNPEKNLSPNELQDHFDEFDQILKQTGLPPIWNGETLVPWKIFHAATIEIARQCHTELGITQPQKQLKGTYSKPVWDPSSKIWTES